ncbi:RimK family alpha-L-glutamate ligase [Nocardioides sp.]|uniref:ATP-grasp domain-containing protein n=1 Tax=Nocardioides sp. TaxID=35761 RepID=UPI0035176E65
MSGISGADHSRTTGPLLLLATCAAWPDGEPGGELLAPAFAAHGIAARWAVWDDPSVDWESADLVAVRSTWDIQHRMPDFLAWARRLGPRLLQGERVFRWNTDKRYLLDLAAQGRVPVIPTEAPEDAVALRAAITRVGSAVVKPRLGAGGDGLVVVHDGEGPLPAELLTDLNHWLVQPLVPSVFDTGERSVFVLGGHPGAQVAKVAPPHDVRVHEHRGGTTRVVSADPELALLAVDAVAATTELLGAGLPYARVDLLHHEGRWCVSEIELTEPGLYLDHLPGNATRFADVVAEHLAAVGG